MVTSTISTHGRHLLAVLAQFSRPVAIGLSVVGASRTVYRNVIAKGREVTFDADTPIQVRLAPGAPSKQK